MKTPLNILVSYAYWNAQVDAGIRAMPLSKRRLMIDSGAFSAWSKGTTVTLDGYCAFLDSIEHLRPFEAIQLDVVGDEDASWRNYEIMRARGYATIPVFTRGAAESTLDRMRSHADYIALGGLFGSERKSAYVKWFAGRTAGHRAHWLGFTDPDFIRRYRPQSCDASSWLSVARWGAVQMWEAGRMRRMPRSRLAKQSARLHLLRSMERISTLGSRDLRRLAEREAWAGMPRFGPAGEIVGAAGFAQVLGTLSWLAMMAECERQHGTHVYLVIGSAAQIDCIQGAARLLRA